jgi:serine/threonine-protein kinase RsbW
VTITAPSGPPLLRDRIGATAEDVRKYLGRVDRATSGDWIDPDHREDALIVLAEVLNNIVEHALRHSPQGWIDVTLTRAGGAVRIETRDNGTPLPPTLLRPDRAAPEVGIATEDLPEDGFGWFIVHALTQDMTYERRGGTNRLTFSVRPAV